MRKCKIVKYRNGKELYIVNEKDWNDARDYSKVGIWLIPRGQLFNATKEALEIVAMTVKEVGDLSDRVGVFTDYPLMSLSTEEWQYALDNTPDPEVDEEDYDKWILLYHQKNDKYYITTLEEWKDNSSTIYTYEIPTDNSGPQKKSEYIACKISLQLAETLTDMVTKRDHDQYLSIDKEEWDDMMKRAVSINHNISQPILNNKQSNKTTMKNSFGGLNIDFGKLESDKLALSFAGVAVKKNNDEYVVYDKANRKLIEVGDLKFDVDFYKLPVQTLAPGDLTIMDGKIFIVDKINDDNSLSCIDPVSGSKVSKISRTNLFNMYFYVKIVSMFDMMGGLGGGDTTPGAFNPMMLMMMSSSDNGGGKGMFGSDMMQMMLMSQMMGGQQGTNPFAAMFGQQQPAAPVKPARTRTTTGTKKS